MSPSPAWYEPADLIEVEPEDVAPPFEDLSVRDGAVWWSAGMVDADAEDCP